MYTKEQLQSINNMSKETLLTACKSAKIKNYSKMSVGQMRLAVQRHMEREIAKPATEKTPAVVTTSTREQRNGVARPGAGTLCSKVWDALDSLIANGKDITFDAVRELAGKEMADATIRTQRQRHREFLGLSRDAKKPALKKADKPVAKEEAQPAA